MSILTLTDLRHTQDVATSSPLANRGDPLDQSFPRQKRPHSPGKLFADDGDSGILDPYCSCVRLETIDLGSTNPGPNANMAKEGAMALIKTINSKLKDLLYICFPWRFSRIIKAKKLSTKRKFMVVVEATVFDETRDHSHRNAVFKGWLMKQERESGDGFLIDLSDVSRRDIYGTTSKCVLQRAPSMKKFCHCRYR